MCPERGAHTAGREQSVTRGHRCLSFTLQRQTQLQQHVALNLATRHQTWQPITRGQGLLLTASNSGTSRGKPTHAVLDYWVGPDLVFMEFKGLGQKIDAAVTTLFLCPSEKQVHNILHSFCNFSRRKYKKCFLIMPF